MAQWIENLPASAGNAGDDVLNSCLGKIPGRAEISVPVPVFPPENSMDRGESMGSQKSPDTNEPRSMTEQRKGVGLPGVTKIARKLARVLKFGFFCKIYEKTQMHFLANPIYCRTVTRNKWGKQMEDEDYFSKIMQIHLAVLTPIASNRSVLPFLVQKGTFLTGSLCPLCVRKRENREPFLYMLFLSFLSASINQYAKSGIFGGNIFWSLSVVNREHSYPAAHWNLCPYVLGAHMTQLVSSQGKIPVWIKSQSLGLLQQCLHRWGCADAIRTRLRPKRMDKTVQDGGNETITDGATILKQVWVSYPAARMLVELWLKRARDARRHVSGCCCWLTLSPIAVTTFSEMDLLFLSSLEDLEKGIKVWTCLDLWNHDREKQLNIATTSLNQHCLSLSSVNAGVEQQTHHSYWA